MKKILKCTKKYLPIIILTPLVLIVEVILEVNIPKVMSEMVDVGIASGDMSIVLGYGKKMTIMAILSLAAGMAGTFLSSTGGMGFGSELRKAVFNKIQDFSFENIDSFQQSSLLTRMTTDVDNVQMGLRMALTMLIRAPFMMVAAATVAYKLNSNLFRIFLVAIPVLAIAIVSVSSVSLPMFRYMLTKYDGLNDKAKEYLTNVRVVKTFVREDYEKQKFTDINKELLETSIKSESLLCLTGPIMSLVVQSCIIAVYYLGGMDVMNKLMGKGELMAFVSYIGQILIGLLMVAMIIMNVVRMKSSVERISEVLNCESSIVNGDYPGEVEASDIEMRNVTFRYASASKDALKDINLHIKAGETVGIIGSTGCGKTSLVQLIPRLYDANEGEVLVGGRNVKEYKLDTLRDAVAMVLQQNVLFSGTIKENMRWGNKFATDEEIKEACKQAQADDFIMAFPDGYDTYLGQGGVNVSGGQKQRLCIARALLKKPKIIILDDSTSAVDTHTDMMIRTALKQQLKGTTTLIIAQRIASVMDADRVIVINNGKIDAIDTPANLLENNEIYRDIYTTQMKGVEADA